MPDTVTVRKIIESTKALVPYMNETEVALIAKVLGCVTERLLKEAEPDA